VHVSLTKLEFEDYEFNHIHDKSGHTLILITMEVVSIAPARDIWKEYISFIRFVHFLARTNLTRKSLRESNSCFHMFSLRSNSNVQSGLIISIRRKRAEIADFFAPNSAWLFGAEFSEYFPEYISSSIPGLSDVDFGTSVLYGCVRYGIGIPRMGKLQVLTFGSSAYSEISGIRENRICDLIKIWELRAPGRDPELCTRSR